MPNKIFQRKKAREKAEQARKGPSREKYMNYVIICEGTKSEPFYFERLIRSLRIRKGNARVYGKNHGADPSEVVEIAIECYREDKTINKIFCVFDKDSHHHYQSSLDRIHQLANRKRKPIPLEAITSVPCFEIWVLLHFMCTSRPWCREGEKSPGNCLVSYLKKNFLPGYEKCDESLFSQIQCRMSEAIINAKLLDQHNLTAETDNPSTKIHELINALDELANPKI